MTILFKVLAGPTTKAKLLRILIERVESLFYLSSYLLYHSAGDSKSTPAHIYFCILELEIKFSLFSNVFLFFSFFKIFVIIGKIS